MFKVRKLLVISVVLLLCIPSFASVKYFGSAQAKIKAVGCVPTMEYLYIEDAPVRFAACIDADIDLITFDFSNNFECSLGCELNCTTRSLAVNDRFIKPYFAAGPYLSLDFPYSDEWTFSNSFKFMFGFFRPMNEKFAYIGYSVSALKEVKLYEKVKTKLVLPLDFTYKNDMLAVSAGIGLKAEWK